MKHMYSNQLVAYLFNEIDAEGKSNIERELATNEALREEFEELQVGLGYLSNCKPMSPSTELINRILEASQQAETMLSH